MELAQRRHIDHLNRRPRSKLTQLHYLILTKVLKTYIGVKTASSTNGVGNLDLHLTKTETRSQSFTLYENQFKMDQRP
jgi:hypothetical protein